MNKWYFPGGLDLSVVGANHAGIESFLTDIPNSLTREIIQNSLDVKNPQVDRPVKIVFSFGEISCQEIPGIEDLKNNVIPLAKEYWKEKNQQTYDFVKKFEKSINKGKIDVLTISDYYTTGLYEVNYDTLVKGEAFSEKNDETAGGSKGIGKFAPFAASELRMVFYNSIDTNIVKRFAGVLNFVSYHDMSSDRAGRKYVTQGRGTYEGNDGGINFLKAYRSESGTDVSIIGLISIEYWIERIVLSVLNNFLVSIYSGNLEVEIHNGSERIECISKESLDEYMNLLERLCDKKTTPNSWKKLMNSDIRRTLIATSGYYKTLIDTSEDKLIFNLPEEWIERYSFIDNIKDGTLQIFKHDNGSRKVLQLRKTGMKISEKANISGDIPFSGIFQATGDKLNSFLRSMENVNHDIWTADRLSTDMQKVAKNFLNDLRSWYKDKIIGSFSINIDDEVDAIGIASLLPLEMVSQGSLNNGDSENGIWFGVKNILKRENIHKTNNTSVDGDSEEKIIAQIAKQVESGEGKEGGSDGYSGSHGNGGGRTAGILGMGPIEGNRGNDSNPVNSSLKFEEIDSSGFLKLKILEINASNGAYILSGISSVSKKMLGIALFSIGENGQSYIKSVTSVSSETNKVDLKGDRVLIYDVQKNERFQISIAIDSTVRVKMRGCTYELKS